MDYYNAMIDMIDDVNDERFRALREIENDKLRVAKVYNKKVNAKIISSRRFGLEDDFTYWV